MTTTSTFSDSLNGGRAYEQLIQQSYPDRLELLDGRHADLRVIKTGELLEVKSESRSLTETPNYFVERVTSNGVQLGGPWQALSKGVQLFAYFFPRNNELHIFHTAAFVERSEAFLRTNTRPFCRVWTNGNFERYYSEGLPIPRAVYADLAYVMRLDALGSCPNILSASSQERCGRSAA